MQSWLEGRNWVGQCAQATEMTSSRILSSKADSNTWESFTRSELKLESVHQESSRSDIFRKRATKPLLKQKHRQKHLIWAKEKNNWTVAQWSKVLFSDESKFSMSFGNQGPRVWRKRGEAQNPCCLKSSVKFPQSEMIWAAMSSAGVGPLCFLKSTVNAVIYQNILEHIMLPSADKIYGDADFIFQQDLAPAHTAKGTKSWFNDHVLLCLIVRESMGYFQEKDEKQSIQTSWRLNSATGWSLPHLTDAGVCAKEAPTKYCVLKWTFFKERELFCFANPFLMDLRKYSNTFEILDFWLSLAVSSSHQN